jgi:NADPH:quinone reductase-like Zn-dependent oxidoreductase
MELLDVEPPPVAPDGVLVRVRAAGLNPVDYKVREGKLADKFPFHFPVVLGWDVAGEVEAVGPAVTWFKPGDAVYGYNRRHELRFGTYAELTTGPEGYFAHMPRELSFEEAAALPLAALTAHQAIERSGLRGGETFFVPGGAGGVGHLAIQLAVERGARVISSAGPDNQDFLRELGAEPIDYRGEDVPARVRELAPDGVAAVFDHVGGPGIADSWRMLARGGTLVSYGTASTRDVPGNPRLPVLKLLARLTAWNVAPNGRRATFFNLWAGKRLRPARFRTQLREDLGAVLALLASGALEPQVARRFALTDAAAALRYAESGGIAGKVILEPRT